MGFVARLRYSLLNLSFGIADPTNHTTPLGFEYYVRRKSLSLELENSAKTPKNSLEDYDMPERKHWDEYMTAYQDVLTKTNTDWAPWHLIPSNHKWVPCGLANNCDGNGEDGPSLSEDESGPQF